MDESGAANQIRVLIIHPHRLLAEALAAMLASEPELVVSGALSGALGVADDAVGTRPDVVLMAYWQFETDAREFLRSLRASQPALKLLVLASTLDDETVSGSLELGAVGCIDAASSPSALSDAIKRAHAGEILFAPEVLTRLLLRARDRERVREIRTAPAALAPREREVLQALAAGLSTDEAAARLGIAIHTVRTHVKNAMGKLGARSKLEAVMAALRAGLIDLPE